MQTAGAGRVGQLRARIAAELQPTFASRSTRTLPLAEMIDPDCIAMSSRRATGQKCLVDPSRR